MHQHINAIWGHMGGGGGVLPNVDHCRVLCLEIGLPCWSCIAWPS